MSIEMGIEKMARVLNIGCGKDFSVGTDFVDINVSDKRVIRYDADNDRLPYEDNTFDKVYSQNIFEHLTNHANFMKECYRVLKPNGEMELFTDNASFISYNLPISKVYGHNYETGTKEDNHYCLFMPLHLINFCNKFGFADAKAEYQEDKDIRPLQAVIKKILYFFLPKNIKSMRLRLTARKK